MFHGAQPREWLDIRHLFHRSNSVQLPSNTTSDNLENPRRTFLSLLAPRFRTVREGHLEWNQPSSVGSRTVSTPAEARLCALQHKPTGDEPHILSLPALVIDSKNWSLMLQLPHSEAEIHQQQCPFCV